jgi:hypothetical protein
MNAEAPVVALGKNDKDKDLVESVVEDVLKWHTSDNRKGIGNRLEKTLHCLTENDLDRVVPKINGRFEQLRREGKGDFRIRYLSDVGEIWAGEGNHVGDISGRVMPGYTPTLFIGTDVKQRRDTDCAFY